MGTQNFHFPRPKPKSRNRPRCTTQMSRMGTPNCRAMASTCFCHTTCSSAGHHAAMSTHTSAIILRPLRE